MNIFMMKLYLALKRAKRPQPLNNPICTEKVTEIIKKIGNNKAAGFDNITGEMIKYGPIILHKVISDNLNNIFETLEINIGKSILKPLQKTNKPKGPYKNLRPMNLLIIIRNIHSNITLQQINPKVNKYLNLSTFKQYNN